MSLEVGVNSYVTENEADTYFDDRYNGSDWGEVPDTEIALVSAADLLDSAFSWYNDKTESTQDLEFPRNEETDVPQKVKNAQCELALEIHLSEGAVLLQVPKLIKTDKVTTEFFLNSSAFPTHIKNLVTKYGRFKSNTDNAVIPVKLER